MTLLRLKYRLRYYWRKFNLFIGRCPDCGTALNYSSYGRPHCGECGKFK